MFRVPFFLLVAYDHPYSHFSARKASFKTEEWDSGVRRHESGGVAFVESIDKLYKPKPDATWHFSGEKGRFTQLRHAEDLGFVRRKGNNPEH